MSILVMKFGGTSVANLNRIKNLYKLVKQKIDSGQKKLVIVVSAMSGVTNSLVKEFKKIDDEINNPEYDVVVSTGEQYSSAIISAYLNKKVYDQGLLWAGKYQFLQMIIIANQKFNL